MIPGPWAAVLLGLAAFRTWRLLAEDELLDRPRRRVMRLGDWSGSGGFPSGYREGLDNFVGCPYCFGFWVGLAWFGAYQLGPHSTLIVAVPFAISAAVGILGSKL